MAVIPIAEPKLKSNLPQNESPRGFAVLALGFRPFYLVAALLALTQVPLWLAVYSGMLSIAPVMPPMLWHGHEMVFGFSAAVIVGFLFTAAKNWTGQPTPTGGALAGLVLLWLAGRAWMLFGFPVDAALVDLSFLPLAGFALARVLVRAKSRRNYFVLVILGLLTLANALTHAGVQGWLPVSPFVGLHLGVALIGILATVIAGRIVPSFTASALRTVPWHNTWVERTAITASALALLAWALEVGATATGVIAAVAAIAQALRIWGWRPLPTWRVPLLWILHLSHAWLVVALVFLALTGAGWASPTPVLHLLTVGMISGLILGMITRTALGHTGRLLKAGAAETACYSLLQIGVLARVLPTFAFPSAVYVPAMWFAGTAWALAFAIYLWRYAPMLWRPRVDGREG